MGLFNLFQLAGQVVLDSAETLTGLNNVQNAATRTGEVFKKIGGGISAAGKSLSTFVTLPILGAMGASIKLASDMNETVSKTGVVFKKGSQEVLNWSDKTLKSIGLAKGTALDMAATYGDMGTAMGLSGTEAQKMAMKLVDLTGDMASFKNMRPDEIHIALTGAYTGETEALKRLGIVMTVANLEQFALSTGIKKSYKEMTQAEKIQLRYNYIMKASKNSVGDFQRTQASASNQMRIFSEGMKETGAKIGTILLPFFTKAINILNNLLDKFSTLNPHMQKVSIVIGLLAAAVGPLLIVLGSVVGAIGSIITIVGALSWPIMAIVGVVGVFIAQWAAYIAIMVIVAKKAGLVKMAIEGLKTIINIFSNILKGNAKNAIDLLVKKFGLSQQEAKKFVKSVQDLKERFIIFANTLREKAKQAFDYLVSKLKIAGTWLYNHRKEIIRVIEIAVKLASTVISTATKVLNAAGKIVQFGLKVAKVFRDVIKAAVNMGVDVGKTLGGLASKAFTWGKNLIGSFINGIVSKAGSLSKALQNTAAKIADFLGFSSPTKEGPGRMADKWAPNLMRMFIKGIIDNKPNLKNAMANISGALAIGDLKNMSMAGVNTGSVNANNSKLQEKIQLIINNPKFFNQQDVDKMMDPVVRKLQSTLGNKRG